MTFYIIFFILIVCLLIWVTIKGKEILPFSHYPMFSDLLRIGEIEVFRIALETKDNQTIWWESHFYRNTERIGQLLRNLYYHQTSDPKLKVVVELKKRGVLKEALRLIKAEKKNFAELRAVRIVKRTAFYDDKGKISVRDEVLERIPIKKL